MMFIDEALTLLELPGRRSDTNNSQVIHKAWKRKLKSAHPDKNASLNATERTQLLNEAKDVLMAQFEDPLAKLLNQVEEEHAAREKEKDLETEKEKEKAALERWMEGMKEESKEARRERYARNRKKRTEDTRMHRRIEEYPEGRALVKEMTEFFKENFQYKAGHVLMCDLLELFIKSREKTTGLEKRLFKRHARRLFAAAWPLARHCKNYKRWGFVGAGVKGPDVWFRAPGAPPQSSASALAELRERLSKLCKRPAAASG